MTCRIQKQTFDVPCESFACFNMGKWLVGNDEGPANLCMVICDECLETLMRSVLNTPHFRRVAYQHLGITVESIKLAKQLIVSGEAEEYKKSLEPEPEPEPIPEEFFKCPYCNKKFDTDVELQAHITETHPRKTTVIARRA